MKASKWYSVLDCRITHYKPDSDCIFTMVQRSWSVRWSYNVHQYLDQIKATLRLYLPTYIARLQFDL